MSIKSRLNRLEQMVSETYKDRVPVMVSLNEESCITWVDAEADSAWVGRHSSQLPKNRPLKVYRGFDPTML